MKKKNQDSVSLKNNDETKKKYGLAYEDMKRLFTVTVENSYPSPKKIVNSFDFYDIDFNKSDVKQLKETK